MRKEEKEIVLFEKKLWLSSPTMHGPELEYMTEAFRTNWVSTVGKNTSEAYGTHTNRKIWDKTDFSRELSVPVQFSPAEEERDPLMQDSSTQNHLQRYPMAVCDPEERWVREYIEQTGEEPGFF